MVQVSDAASIRDIPFRRSLCVCGNSRVAHGEIAKLSATSARWLYSATITLAGPAMKTLLIDMNTTVADAGGRLPATDAERWRQCYRQRLEEADSECPPPNVSLREAGKRGRLKRSKARNLLEKLRNFEHDVLRFMDVEYVPFTHNQGKNDLRMTKVQQKISGCFRSMEGAKIFCRVRSYLSTCRKQGMSATEALALLFQGKNPAFMDTDETQF